MRISDWSSDVCSSDLIQESIFTRIGANRVLKFAYELAQKRGKHLTEATKSNGISISMPWWDDRVAEIGKQYPDVRWGKLHIDILFAHLVQRPAYFDVVMDSNLLGDILSDLGPAFTGHNDIAPSTHLN